MSRGNRYNMPWKPGMDCVCSLVIENRICGIFLILLLLSCVIASGEISEVIVGVQNNNNAGMV